MHFKNLRKATPLFIVVGVGLTVSMVLMVLWAVFGWALLVILAGVGVLAAYRLIFPEP